MNQRSETRADPRRIGSALEWVGVRVERIGLWMQRQAAEVAYRELHALGRWGS